MFSFTPPPLFHVHAPPCVYVYVRVPVHMEYPFYNMYIVHFSRPILSKHHQEPIAKSAKLRVSMLASSSQMFNRSYCEEINKNQSQNG